MDAGYLIKAVLLGFTAGVMPGSFQAFLINQAATHSWRRAAFASLAPLLSDGPIVVAALLLLTYIPPWGLLTLQIAGGLFMLYLAFGALKDLLAVQKIETPAAAPKNFVAAVCINFLNPNVYIYWTTVSGPLFISGWRQAAWWGILFLLCFYLTMVLASNVIIAVVVGLRSLGGSIQRVLRLISVALMVLMAALQLFAGISGLIR